MVRKDDERGVFADHFAHTPQPAIDQLIQLCDPVFEHRIVDKARVLAIHEMPEHMAPLIHGAEVNKEQILVRMGEKVIQGARAFVVGEEHLVPKLVRVQHPAFEGLGVLRDTVRVEAAQLGAELL